MPAPIDDAVGSRGESAQQQNLREFLEAIEACNTALDEKERQAVDVDIIASEAIGRADSVLQVIGDELERDWSSLVESAEATDRALDQTTAAAHAIGETELPDAVERLSGVPALLDAAVDPARAELGARFDRLRDVAFAAMAGHVQQAGTSLDAADDGSSSLQPFLELPGEAHALAEAHASDQQQEVAGIDERPPALAAAGAATHDAAESGARAWGETCADAVEQLRVTKADAIRTTYETWAVAAESQGADVTRAFEELGARLTAALDIEDGRVDQETGQAQDALDQLHDQMKKANEELTSGESVLMSLAELALPELAIARRMVDKIKDLTEAMGP